MPFDHFGLIAPIFSNVGYSSLETMLEQADLPTPGRVLDAGGGTGRVANAIREHAGEVVIADPSLGMLREADQTQLKLACSNSEALPFPSGSFERIIMVDALHHVIHQGETAHEMYRVLKPGGAHRDRRAGYPLVLCQVDRGGRKDFIDAQSLPCARKNRGIVLI